MSDYDNAARRTAKLDPLSFLLWLPPAFSAHLRFRRWLDTRTVPFPGDPERTGDTVAELEAIVQPAPLWAFPVEFQYEPDPEMFGRLLIFLGSLWQQLRPDDLRGRRYQLAAAVINLTGTSSSLPASQDYALPGFDGLRCTLQVRELHLQTMPAAPLLERIRSGELSRALLIWIPLMLAEDASGIIAQWVELASAEPDERLSAEYAALTKVFARLSLAADQWFRVLEGWKMKTSPFLDEVRAESRAEDILRLLRLRLKIDPPADLRARVEEERNLDRLKRWMDAAATANSLDEFLAAFHQD
jgi:hypothetical protein